MSASSASTSSVYRAYYRLAKPGIVYGNVFTTIAAFLYASQLRFNGLLFIATILGIGLVIASACVFNNYLDRDMDAKMERTARRALVTGKISVRSALIYGTILGLIGIGLLYIYVNALTAGLALFGFVMYVGAYTRIKRTSEWAAVVGAIPGAVPIVVGYTAVTNRLDTPAIILFIILALWQLPHFYAIALYRLKEYGAAGIPTLPARKGIAATKVHIVSSIVAYVLAASSLTIFGYAGYGYLALALILGIMWLAQSAREYRSMEPSVWARRVFLFSLIVLVAFSVTLAFASVLP
jgi:protoheme IX farnesyltransferase